MKKQFNFNNEEYLLDIDVAEDGRVTFDIDGVDMEFKDVNELAERYAIARNVTTDNLKNWVLVEDGDVYSYVLKAATAGRDFFAPEDDTEDEEEYTFYWGDGEDDEDDEYDTCDECDDIIDNLTTEEYRTLQLMTDNWMRGNDDEDDLTIEEKEELVDYLLEDEDRIQEVRNKVDELRDFGLGSFEVGYNVTILIKELSSMNDQNAIDELMSMSQNEKANQALKVAQIAKRDDLQMLHLNLNDETLTYIKRSVNDPIRRTELVLKRKAIPQFIIIEQ